MWYGELHNIILLIYNLLANSIKSYLSTL
jgi:hypothetical protein